MDTMDSNVTLSEKKTHTQGENIQNLELGKELWNRYHKRKYL